MISEPGLILNFLSRFLPLSDDWSGQWRDFNEHFKAMAQDRIYPTAFPDKDKFRHNFNFVLERMFFYCRFPWLGRKSLNARIGYNSALAADFGLGQLVNIPVLYAKTVTTGLYNPAGSFLACSLKEISNIIASLRESRANPEAVISLISIEDASMPEDLALMDFPWLCQLDNIFFRPLLSSAERIQLYPTGKLSTSAMRFLQIHRPAFSVQIESAGTDSHILHQPGGKGGGYIPFEFLCKCFLYSPLAWQTRQKDVYLEQEKALTNDVILNEGELRQTLLTMRDKVRGRLDSLRKWEDEYGKAAKALIDQARDFDRHIVSVSGLNPHTDKTYQHNGDWSAAESHILDLVVTRNLPQLIKFCDSLAAYGYPYGSILASAKAALGHGFADMAIVNIGSGLANALCVLLRGQLGLKDGDAGRRFARQIMDRTPTLAASLPELYYTAGISLFLDGTANQGIRYLKLALMEGYKEAGQWLYDHASRVNDKKIISFLARMMVPAACFVKATEKNPYPGSGRGLFYLYAAASQYHKEAMRTLAVIEGKKGFGAPEEAHRHRLHSIAIFRIMEKEGVSLSSSDAYMLGRLLHMENNYSEALKYLGLSKEAKAATLLGRMYMYGDGVGINYATARSYLEEASAKGDKKAPDLLEKLAEKENAQNKNRRGDYRPREEHTSTTTTSSGSACFLTTAACAARGLPDDCDVLQTYRRYRDQVLMTNPAGRALVDRYYSIAPGIVEAIEARQDRMDIYETMWTRYLKPGYQLVLANKNEEAKDLYIALVHWLVGYLK